jgi:hypothetical protein
MLASCVLSISRAPPTPSSILISTSRSRSGRDVRCSIVMNSPKSHGGDTSRCEQNQHCPAPGALMSPILVCRSITAMVRPCQCSSKAAISASNSGHRVDVGLKRLIHGNMPGGVTAVFTVSPAVVIALPKSSHRTGQAQSSRTNR